MAACAKWARSEMARLQEDVRRLRFWRGIIAEFLGSLFVVFVGCTAFTVTYDEHSLAVKVGLAFGLTYAAVFYCMRHVGNAHLNPIVTVAMLLTRRASVIRCLLFIAAQFIGAILGAGFAVAVTASQLRSAGQQNVSSRYVWFGGCTVLANGVSESQAFGIEFLASFLVVFVVFACYEKTKYDQQSQAAPFVIGLIYAATIMATMPYTGGSVNTARSFGAALVNAIWTDHWVFWFGPLLGGACGGAVFDVIFSTKSSFTRIRNCFTVFHRRDDDAGSEAGEKPHGDVEPDAGDGEEVGEPRKDGTAPTDELEVISESKEQPSSQHKPRLKLLRPKFACCGGQETARDEVAAGGTATSPDDTEREPEAKVEQPAEETQ